MRKHTLWVLAISLLFNISVFSQNKALQDFISTPSLRRANISLLVKNVATSNTVLEYRSKTCAIPASTTKIVTTAAALEMLSPDFKFETVLQYDGNISNGVLNGNIYILGGLDPTLGSKYMGTQDFLSQWLMAIKGMGIEEISGNIIADASLINNQGISPKWTWEDMGNYYGAGAYALSVYDNVCTVGFKTGAPGTIAEVVSCSPDLPDFSVKSYVKAANTNSDDSYFYGAPLIGERTIYGTLPANRSAFYVKADIYNPPFLLAQRLCNELKSNGIQVDGKPDVMWKKEKGARMRVAIHVIESPALSEIVSDINHRSNNHYAEHVYRYMGSKQGEGTDTDAGANVIKSYWKSRGLDTEGLLQFDGCGLSTMNAITADFLVSLLIYEKNKAKYSDEFYESLPVAGVNGTVKKLLKGTKLEGKVYAKSGSISRTQCYAGYIEWKGETYAFAVMVNNFSGARNSVLKAIENVLLSVAN